LIEPAIFTRVGSTPAAAVALNVSTDMCLVPRSPRNDPLFGQRELPIAQAGVTLRQLWLMVR
jgi:hypothetical protein